MTSPQAAAKRRQVTHAAWALALLLIATGTWHFAAPNGFESIVPRFLGSPAFWVNSSGAAELACAAALLIPPARSTAGWACAVLFVAVYPANITMALDSSHAHGNQLIAWLRLPLQIPLIMWAVYIARRADRTPQAPLAAPEAPHHC